jgi:hypothetical protein
MSEMMILEQARVRLEGKRRQLAGVLASGESDMAELAAAFTAIQKAIEAIDNAIVDERRQVDPMAAGSIPNSRR